MRIEAGTIGCAVVVAAGFTCLGLAMSGLMTGDPLSHYIKTLGGFAGYFAVCAGVVTAMVNY